MFRLAFSLVLNTARVAAAVVVLILSKKEVPQVPLRSWIVVYALLCCVQIILDCILRLMRPRSSPDGGDNLSKIGKLIIAINLAVYYIWLLVGLYWVVSGGQMLADHAPKLYWLSVILVAIDMLLTVINIVVNIVITCRGRISRETANNSLNNADSPVRIARRELLSDLIETCSLVSNIASVVATVGVFLLSINEDPQIELRSWIFSYGLICIFYVYISLANERGSSNRNASDHRAKCVSSLFLLELFLLGVFD